MLGNMPKQSRISEPDFAKAVAEAYSDGMSRAEMAAMFNVSKPTITTWTRDPRVQAHASKMALDRVNRITRKVDSEIDARLQHIDNWDIDTILKVRKEYLDRSLKIDLGVGATAETTNEILEAMDSDPDFAEAILELADKSKK